MIKKDLAQRLSTRTGIEERLSTKIIDIIFDILAESFEKEEDSQFRGFGTFKIVETKPKVGRVIATGEPVHIPARKKVVFKFFRECK